MTKRPRFTINGEPASLREVRHGAKEESLRRALGDYITGKEANQAVRSLSELAAWRDTGKVRAMKIGAMWYYSRQDLLQALKAEPDRGPKPK